MHATASIAARIPDLPRWVEPRDLLLWGGCEIHGLIEAPELAVVVRNPGADEVFVIGAPAPTAVLAAVQRSAGGGYLIAPTEQATWIAQLLRGWRRSRDIIHVLHDPARLPVPSDGDVAFLDPSALGEVPMSADLRQELREGGEHSPIAASFANEQPVSFCYAGAITESLWDVAIDTLPQHRRQGHAARCAAHMIRHMKAHGKAPVWQAVEDNPASWRLAEKLGFVAVDELAMFLPGGP